MVRFLVYKSSSGHCDCRDTHHKAEHKKSEEEFPRRDTVRLTPVAAVGMTAEGVIELTGPPAALSGFVSGSTVELGVQ